MYTDTQTKRRKTDTTYPRINITDYVSAFIRYIRQKEGRVFDMRHSGNINYMVELINKPEYTTFRSVFGLNGGSYYWHEQKVEYMPSNLGSDRGYVFYFCCNSCFRRVKYLYKISTTESPLCHRCSGLKYRVPTRKERSLSRLLRKPYFSESDKYLIVKRAGITKQDIGNDWFK